MYVLCPGIMNVGGFVLQLAVLGCYKVLCPLSHCISCYTYMYKIYTFMNMLQIETKHSH